MIRKYVTFLLLLVIVVFLVGCAPSGWEIYPYCYCTEITEGTNFSLLNETSLIVYNTTNVINNSNLCSYKIFPAPERDYYGVKDTTGLLHYRTPCFPLFTGGLYEDQSNQYYYCQCRK